MQVFRPWCFTNLSSFFFFVLDDISVRFYKLIFSLNSLNQNEWVTVYCTICGQRNHQIASLNWLCLYLSFLNIFFNKFFPVEKCEVTWHCLYHKALTLIYHVSSNKHRTLAAPLSTCNEVSISLKALLPSNKHCTS